MTENQIKQSYDRIQLSPGAEARLQGKIDAALKKPMRETRVVLKPKKKLWRPALAAAAAVALLLLGVLGLLRLYEQNPQPTQLTPAAQPEATVEVGAEAAPVDYLSMYSSVLERYVWILSEELEGSQGISLLCRNFYGSDPLDRLGFALEDLNGDGVPELLVGCTEGEVTWGYVLFDMYTLKDGKAEKLLESMERIRWYDCGGGLLLRDSSGGAGRREWALFSFGEDLTEVETLSFDADRSGGAWYLWLAPVNGEVAALDPWLTQEEAEEWQEQYCTGYVYHSYTPFSVLYGSSEPTATPEPEQIAGLTEEEYAQLRYVLGELMQKEESFALTEYAARQPDGVVLLLEQLEKVSEARGLTGSEIRGLLYGRENLDGASAEAYASFLLRLYQRSPAEFLWAWHEAGEPAELMLEITGKTDSDEAIAWLQQQWALYYGAEARENAAAVDGEGQAYAVVTLENGQNVIVIIDPRIKAESMLLTERLSQDELRLRLLREEQP